MQRFLLICFILMTATGNGWTQNRGMKKRNKECPSFIYRVTLRDKQNSPYSLNHPTRFLSRRSVERRKRQGLPLDSTDLPVTPKYVRQIETEKVNIVGTSRWNNTVLVQVKDTNEMARISKLPYVALCKKVWQAPDSIEPTAIKTKYEERFHEWDSIGQTPFGRADLQIKSLQGHRLHSIDLKGEGMVIAVLDGGFKNVNQIPAFQKVNIKGTKDFIYPLSPSVYYELDHGTKVLSVMAIQEPHYYIGTAPEASYWLLRCEDPQSEQEVEEDYWAMAVEFADSVGVDVVNSSLGYNTYDAPFRSYELNDLDGKTALISRTASMMARKGIVLCNSAGNSGMGTWKKITVPADAFDILTIGAIDQKGRNAAFSSVGPTQDGRVKPDIVAMGNGTALISGRGMLVHDMGTSFSTPIVTGLVACLWQGLRHKTALEIIDMVRHSASHYSTPNNIYGYGIPNFWEAYSGEKRKDKNE